MSRPAYQILPQGRPPSPALFKLNLEYFIMINFGVDVDDDDIEVDEEEKDDLGHV